MENKKLIQQLGFIPKENTSGIYHKRYTQCDGYSIDIDFDKEIINYGNKITSDSKTTQNFAQKENWVVLECVDRLLEKGYSAEDITLEKVFPSGHGYSGRLDILVVKEGKAFLMIECKTCGKEYDKELKSIHKNGGQLFTYFQNDTNTQFLMLYASHLNRENIDVKWDIVKVEDHYRGAGNVADFYDRWSKVTYQNGIFEDWVLPYMFENKLLTKKELLPLKETDSNFIFHEFMSILRKHSVSDEPNAFNKIFNLFLAKIYDEKKRDDDELEFQWREKTDDAVEFQIRLINLYQKGMFEFLRKEIKGIDDRDFKYKTDDELRIIKKRWLTFNNVFAIKEVVDDESFEDNHRVLKEVVELLHKYQIRYPRRQTHLSDFFERLLTTGLKQKAGQFFSPPPITRFIAKSLPLKKMINEGLKEETVKLPAVIDYAVGSGHFITEIMEEYQNIIDNDIDTTNLYPDVKEDIAVWQHKKYDWAAKYIYGIEKDYRLVKVAKVGCYFYGDGLAQIIHGDGLDSFKDSKSYVGRLRNIDISELEKFSVVVSNPPYSVPTFKGDLKNKNAKEEFELYDLLTDRSSEIESLFIERTKHLLKEDGVAGIILPSSILSSSGSLYTKSREIILHNFDIVAITEFGSNTFMATTTKTVTLFLKRKYKNINQLKYSVAQSIKNSSDVTINGVENSLSKYVAHVWDNIKLDDYVTLLKEQPNETIESHDIYKEYKKDIKGKEFFQKIIEKEEEKLFYFVLAKPQKVVLVKTGTKNEEKKFLGYIFKNGKGSEGIHPVNGRSTIDKCTKLYNTEDNNDITKANSYISKAFEGNYSTEIDESLRENVFYVNFVDMLTFNRVNLDLSIVLNTKKKIDVETKWNKVRFDEVADIIRGITYSKSDQTLERTGKIVLTADNVTLEGKFEIKKEVYLYDDFNAPDDKKLKKNDIFICFSSGSILHLGKVAFIENDTNYLAGGFMGIIRVKKEKSIESKYIYQLLNSLLRQTIRDIGSGSNINNLSGIINEVKIPLPPIDVQRKIVLEITNIEEKEEELKKKLDELRNKINHLIDSSKPRVPLKNLLKEINPSKDKISSLDKNTEVSFLSMSDVDNKGNITNLQVRKLQDVSKGYTFFQDNDVLFAKITPCMENGKGALVQGLKNNIGFGSTEFFVLRSDKEKLLPKILFYYMQNDGLRKEAEKNMTGTSGHRRVPISFLESYLLPNIPLEMQKKIVSEIEKIEEQIMTLEKQLADIPKQKEAILKEYL